MDKTSIQGETPMALFHPDDTYLSLLEEVVHQGRRCPDRTGTGTLSLFGPQAHYSLTEGFPLLTTKKVYPKGVFTELLWYLQGRTNNRWLQDRNTTVWDEWAPEDGALGPLYGYQWRHFGAPYVRDHEELLWEEVGGVDQVLQVLQGLRDDPHGRRHIITAWNPTALPEMALPPCHAFVQFYVTDDEEGKPTYLSSKLTQRSGDLFLGVPWNIACYSALTQLFAELLHYKPLEFIHSLGDAHIYLNHLEQVREQLSRRGQQAPPPRLRISHPKEISLDDPYLFHKYEPEDFLVEDYHPLPAIKAPVAI